LKYSDVTSGIVVNLKVKGQAFPTMNSVYMVTESVKFKSKKVEFDFLT